MASKPSFVDCMYCSVEKCGTHWLGGFKRDYFMDKPIDEDQICPLCNGVCREPMQTSCEHIFCRTCLEQCVASSEPNCPIDRERLQSSNFKNKREEKKILSKRVRCPKDCSWESVLSCLEEHLRGGCKVDQICECGVSLPRVELELHRRTKCPKRLVRCKHCEDEMAAEMVEVHLETCDRCPHLCALGCGEQVTKREMHRHEEICPNKLVSCSFSSIGCEIELFRSKQDEHVDSAVKEHLLLACKAISELRGEVSELCSNVPNRPYVWRVPGVEEGVTNNTKLVSPEFYRDGYKFCAKLHLGGARQGEGTHVSAYLAVAKGANDSSLEWPIKAGSKFSLTLLNQQTDRLHVTMSRTVHPEDYPRPLEGTGKFWGFNKFVSHQQLMEQSSEVQYCVGDTVYVFIQVSLLSDLPKWLKP